MTKLDVKNLLCPMPVIKVQDKVAQMQTGEMLIVTCTDPGTLHDIPAWCRIHGHEFLSFEQSDREIEMKIKIKHGE